MNLSSAEAQTRVCLGAHEGEIVQLDRLQGLALVRWLNSDDVDWEPVALLRDNASPKRKSG
jgi:hypothetical protein